MHSAKRRFLAFALAGSLGLTVAACDSSSTSKAQEGAATTEQAAPETTSETASGLKLEELPFYAKGPVAVVDGVEVPAERFNIIAERRAMQMPAGMPGQMLQIYKKQTMDIVVDEFLIERKIAADKVEVSDQEITEALAEFKSRFPSEEIFAEFMKHNQIDESVIRDDIGKDLALRKLVEKSQNLDVSEEQARAFYEEHKHRFLQQEEVQASHILLKLEEGADEAKIDELRKKADGIAKEARKPGADFAELAKTNSEGPSADRGGELDFFPRNRMVPEFSNAAFALKVGEVSDPVRTQFGWHVIKVTDRRDERQLPFEEVREVIDAQLTNTIMREALGTFLTDLKKDVKIELKEDNVVVNAPADDPQMGMPALDGPGNLQLQLNNPALQPSGDDHAGHAH